MQAKPSTARGPLRREGLRAALGLAFQAAVLFGAAGRLDWGLAWAYLGLVAGLSLGQLWILKRDPDLAAERAAGFRKGPGWDRALVVAMTLPGSLGVWILAGLQQRFGWTPEAPLWLSLAALPVALSGFGLFLWALRSNTFFAPVVRLQRERSQSVVSAGPYARLRHPGYLGWLVFALAMPLVLGSYWALVTAPITLGATVLRTHLEDRLLRRDLEGYEDYARRVPWLLLPGFW